jgi:hypothetical protein
MLYKNNYKIVAILDEYLIHFENRTNLQIHFWLPFYEYSAKIATIL